MLLLENAAACWMPFALGLSEHRHYLFLAGGLCTAVAMQATALRTLTGLRLQIYPDVPDIPNGLRGNSEFVLRTQEAPAHAHTLAGQHGRPFISP